MVGHNHVRHSARQFHAVVMAVLVLGCTFALLAAPLMAPRPAMAAGDWIHNPTTGHYYLYVDYGMTWQDAEDYAVACGGHLVTINNAAEETWLLTQYEQGFWIGMNDLVAEGTWVWSSGEAVTYTHWYPGEPNNYGDGEDGALLEDGGDIGWSDLGPTDERPFVVEADSESDPPPLGDPRFCVDPQDNTIWGYSWPAGANLIVTLNDLTTPITPDYTGGAQANASGEFELGGLGFDIEADQVILVTDGTTPKTHAVTSLTITGVDPVTGVVSGTADSGSQVELWINDTEVGRTVTADARGDWTADFTADYDVVAGTEGGAAQPDLDGDQTQANWRVPDPGIEVNCPDGWIWGWDWAPGDTVHVTIDDPATGLSPDAEFDTVPGEDGTFPEDYPAELEPGFTVSASDGSATKTHVVTSVMFTEADVDADTVSGTAEAGTHVIVEIFNEDGNWRDAIADGGGTWTADFSVPGTGDQGDAFDIRPGTEGKARQDDDDGDYTSDHWAVPNPQFYAAPARDGIGGNQWPVGADLLVTVDDLSTGPTPDFTDSAHVEEWGEFDLYDLGGFDLKSGQLVTVTDGTTTKTHIVTSLLLTNVDAGADTVSGTAAPGSQVDVWINDADVQRTLTADPGGDWTADFSGDFDIGPGSEGAAAQSDEDGDETSADWRVPNPRVGAGLTNDGISLDEWPPGSTVAVNVFADETPGADLLFSDDVIVDADGYGDVGTVSPLDLVAGLYVTATDGITTKTLNIAPIAITGVDEVADTISGTASPGAQVDVWSWDGASGFATADALGNWSTGLEGNRDLVPGDGGEAAVFDDDGDASTAEWRLAMPTIWADSNADACSASDFLPLATVTFTFDDGAHIHTWSGTTDNQGYIESDASLTFDIEAGQLASATDGVTTKTLEVEDLRVTAVDVVGDTITGTAPVGRSVRVFVGIGDDMWSHELWATANGSGVWTADFSTGATAYDIGLADEGLVHDRDIDFDSNLLWWTVASSNQPPTAAGDTGTVAEDGSLSVAAPGILANDDDPDDDALTAEKLTDPSNGTLALMASGGYVYTPKHDFNGKDTFTYRANDGAAHSSAVMVTITVTAVNDAPVAAGDAAVVAAGAVLTVPAPGVLANDTDVDGDPLTAVKSSDPAHGTLALAANGGFTYTPAAGWVGADSFTYRASDGTILSAPVTVNITVTGKRATVLTITSAPATIDYGGTFTLAGTLRSGGAPVSGAVVVLEVSTDGTTFSATALADTTKADGTFAISDKPTTKTWYRARFAETSTYLGAVSLGSEASVRPSVRTPIAPKKMTRSKASNVYGYLKPQHKAGTYPVRIYKWKKTKSGKWKSYGYVKAKASDYSSYTKYSVKLKLTSKGSWRLCAFAPADGGHASAWSSGYDYVKVK